MNQPMHTGSIKTSDCFTANLCGKESKMNHLGDTNKMVRDTPRMDASAHDDGAIWETGCDIERELNAANAKIKRLENAGDEIEMILLGYASRVELPKTMAIEQSDLSKRLCVNWRKAKEAKL